MFFSNLGFDGMPGGMGMPHRSHEPADTDKLYKILELSKDCSAGDIKKAYRKLAIKHHPDKGGDPEKFKEISRAYEILSDPEKRSIYDQHGEEGLEGNFSAGDATDIFDFFFGGGGTRKQKSKKRGEDVVSQLKVTLEQIYNGSMKKLSINKNVICEACDGNGGPKDAFVTCSVCNGQGYRVQIRQMGSMIQQTQSQCSNCNTNGKILPDDKKCKSCFGKCVKPTKKILEVFVERGVPDQHKITFHGEADERPNEITGNVVFVVCEQPHDRFKRHGHDLFMVKNIPLYEAITGCTFYVKHLDGRIIKVKTPENRMVTPGSVKVINNEGMPVYKSAFSKGNLYITFEVDFPVEKMLTASEKNILLKLFPYEPETLDPKLASGTTIEEVVAFDTDMDEYNARASAQHHGSTSHDTDEDHDGNGRVQCKQQ